MARPTGDAAVTLSLIDRLIDTDPKSSAEVPLSRSKSISKLKDSLRRDLEWLLNSRRIADEPEESLRELARSLYVHGLPDFTAYNVGSQKDQVKLVRSIQASLKIFEPRLANIRIVPLEVTSKGIRTIQFRIDALLLMDPAPERVSFDTVLRLSSGEYEVKGEDSAG